MIVKVGGQRDTVCSVFPCKAYPSFILCDGYDAVAVKSGVCFTKPEKTELFLYDVFFKQFIRLLCCKVRSVYFLMSVLAGSCNRVMVIFACEQIEMRAKRIMFS